MNKIWFNPELTLCLFVMILGYEKTYHTYIATAWLVKFSSRSTSKDGIMLREGAFPKIMGPFFHMAKKTA